MKEYRKYITFLLFLITIGSYSQSQNTMRKFDIQKFEENRERNCWIYETNDSIYELRQGRYAAYSEQVSSKNSTLETLYTYHKNGALKSIQNLYYHVKVGVHKEYDEYGNLIKEIDFDKNFAFSMDDLRTMLYKMFGFDIKKEEMSPTGYYKISRRGNPPAIEPTYRVYVPLPNRYEGQSLTIDGTTGVILSHTDSDLKDLMKDPEYRKKYEIYLTPTAKDSLEYRDWTPLID